MLPASAPSTGLEPAGIIPLHKASSHEVLVIAQFLRHQSDGLRFFDDPYDGGNLEPFVIWKIPFRSGTIIIMRGFFSGRLELDFSNYDDISALDFIRHFSQAVAAALGKCSHSSAMNKTRQALADCDRQGCPSGYTRSH